MFRILIILILILISNFVNLQGQNISRDTFISLITCDPGSEVYSLFGHSAVRVKYGSQDLIYNYGTFDFNTPGFTLKFMRGKLPYHVTINSFGRFLQTYHFEKRGVIEQIVALPSSEQKSLIEFLKWNALPENAEYKYDFFFDNCSTRIRDIFQNITNENTKFPINNIDLTYRDMLHQYLTGHPWTEYGIDLVIGSLADRQADVSHQMFLPDYLSNHLGNSTLMDQNILYPSQKVLIFDEEKSIRKERGWFTPNLIFILLSLIWIILFFARKCTSINVLNKITFVLLGIMSLVISFLWFATDHIATGYNYNLLWLSPIVWWLVFSKNNSTKKKLSIFLIVLTVIGLLFSVIGLIPQAHPSILFAVFLIVVYCSSYFTIENKIHE